MTDNYKRPTILDLVDMILSNNHSPTEYIDQITIKNITKELGLKNKKNGHIYYKKIKKEKIVKISLLCLKELINIIEKRNIKSNNYECSLLFELKPLFIYNDLVNQKIEDVSDYAKIVSNYKDILYPNNLKDFINEFDNEHPPKLILRKNKKIKKNNGLNFLNIEKYIGKYLYSIEFNITNDKCEHGIYYNRYILIRCTPE